MRYWDEFGRMPRALAISFWLLGIAGAALMVWLVVLLGMFFGWWG